MLLEPDMKAWIVVQVERAVRFYFLLRAVGFYNIWKASAARLFGSLASLFGSLIFFMSA